MRSRSMLSVRVSGTLVKRVLTSKEIKQVLGNIVDIVWSRCQKNQKENEHLK